MMASTNRGGKEEDRYKERLRRIIRSSQDWDVGMDEGKGL